jgi:hypothetical protein
MGEYPEEYENGKFDGAPDVWIAGLNDLPGNSMIGMPSWERRNISKAGRRRSSSWIAKVFMVQQRACVPAGCYDDG